MIMQIAACACHHARASSVVRAHAGPATSTPPGHDASGSSNYMRTEGVKLAHEHGADAQQNI